jgi:uncharacterized repeat protein (TIGR01451 family)
MKDTSRVGRRRARQRRARVSMAVVLATVLLPVTLIFGGLEAGAATATIVSPGPLTAVGISDQLNCSVNHTGDAAGEFYNGTACGTFLVVDGTMYFSPAAIPAGQPSATPFTPVSQTGPTGTGTEADPFTVVTVVAAGSTGVRLTQTDTYVTGLESYRTDIAISNTSGVAHTTRLYRAGDCYLQSSDTGYGAVDTATGAVACTTGLEAGSRIEQWFPLTAGSSYMEAGFSTVWSTIASMQPFPNTCTCTSLLDNGAGLSWDVSVPAGASRTVSSLITFSPLGRLPLSLDKTADAGSVAAGGTDGYTITASNPNAGAVTLSTLVDTLPAGFAYVPGSTTGATTANPSIAGQDLTWSNISVPGSGTATLHFSVTAPSTAGTYTNEASGTATDFTVAPTGPTAPVIVTSSAPLVVALSPATATNPVGANHTVTATVTRNSVPQPGVAVGFGVVSGPNTGTVGGGTTGAAGTATFTYTSATAGTDTIRASVVEGETTITSNDVTKTWQVPVSNLTVTSSTSPSPVTAGQRVLNTATVTNGGTTAATGVNVTLTIGQAGATFSSVTPSQGTCDPPSGTTVVCHLGTLAAGGGSASIRSVVNVPGTVPPGGQVTVTAAATSAGGGSGTASSGSTVQAATPGQASGYVPPGGTLATGTTATPADNTVISFTLPNTGPGAPITLRAENDPTLRFCGGQACSGKTAFLSPFTGYEDPMNPPSLKVTWDRTVAGRGIFSDLYVQKDPTGPVVKVPECAPRPRFDRFHHEYRGWWAWVIWWLQHLRARLGPHSGIASPSPCVNARSVDRNGDVSFEILLLSGDPKFGRR